MSLLLAVAAAAAAQTASPPLTLREAQGLAPRDLASRVLGAAGSFYREARVSDGGGPFGYSGVGGVEFASVPRSAASAGLCVADIVSVPYAWGWNGRTGADRPRRPGRIETRHVYRIVGDTSDRKAWTSESERALNAQCAQAGPVFTDGPRPRFFGQSEDTPVDMAARMLQAVIAEARRGQIGRVTCAEDPHEPDARACTDPGAVLAGLRVDWLTYLWVDRCRANPAHLCATFAFAQPGGSEYEWKQIEIVIESDAESANPAPASPRFLSVAIRHLTMAV